MNKIFLQRLFIALTLSSFTICTEAAQTGGNNQLGVNERLSVPLNISYQQQYKTLYDGVKKSIDDFYSQPENSAYKEKRDLPMPGLIVTADKKILPDIDILGGVYLKGSNKAASNDLATSFTGWLELTNFQVMAVLQIIGVLDFQFENPYYFDRNQFGYQIPLNVIGNEENSLGPNAYADPYNLENNIFISNKITRVQTSDNTSSEQSNFEMKICIFLPQFRMVADPIVNYRDTHYDEVKYPWPFDSHIMFEAETKRYMYTDYYPTIVFNKIMSCSYFQAKGDPDVTFPIYNFVNSDPLYYEIATSGSKEGKYTEQCLTRVCDRITAAEIAAGISTLGMSKATDYFGVSLKDVVKKMAADHIYENRQSLFEDNFKSNISLLLQNIASGIAQGLNQRNNQVNPANDFHNKCNLIVDSMKSTAPTNNPMLTSLLNEISLLCNQTLKVSSKDFLVTKKTTSLGCNDIDKFVRISDVNMRNLNKASWSYYDGDRLLKHFYSQYSLYSDDLSPELSSFIFAPEKGCRQVIGATLAQVPSNLKPFFACTVSEPQKPASYGAFKCDKLLVQCLRDPNSCSNIETQAKICSSSTQRTTKVVNNNNICANHYVESSGDQPAVCCKLFDKLKLKCNEDGMSSAKCIAEVLEINSRNDANCINSIDPHLNRNDYKSKFNECLAQAEYRPGFPLSINLAAVLNPDLFGRNDFYSKMIKERDTCLQAMTSTDATVYVDDSCYDNYLAQIKILPRKFMFNNNDGIKIGTSSVTATSVTAQSTLFRNLGALPPIIIDDQSSKPTANIVDNSYIQDYTTNSRLTTIVWQGYSNYTSQTVARNLGGTGTGTVASSSQWVTLFTAQNISYAVNGSSTSKMAAIVQTVMPLDERLKNVLQIYDNDKTGRINCPNICKEKIIKKATQICLCLGR